MKYYLTLQYTRLTRWLKDMGINPVLGFVLGLILFVVLSELLFYKTIYAPWVYGAMALFLCSKWSDAKRNRELRKIFTTKEYYSLRVAENILSSLPFLIFLLMKTAHIPAAILLIASILLAFIRTNRQWNKPIPTPFKKLPFEFIVGFRKSFWAFGLAYILIGKAIQADNYYLGLFGMALIFLTSMLFYQKPEPKYFVWIHTHRAPDFLKRKMITSAICVSILSALALILLLIPFSENWVTTLLVYLGGYIFLGSMILAKYSAYPYEINIPQGIFYALSLMFPPILLIAIWVFYKQSKKRLEPILEC
ncbi:MAG: ABC transporter permease [Bacteroidetes bacterium]|nr:ABC transporter permease [Bacteroidota bacterium]